MSLIINAPTSKVATYDVANQTDIQFNFEFDPSQFQADGTTLVIQYDGNEVRLENFFAADGTTHVQNFLTQDGQEFSAPEFLAAILGTEGGPDTAEDLETAAGAAGGGSGAGAYDDDAGSLYAGLNALGDQPDAYDQPSYEPLEEVPGATAQSGDNEIIFEPIDIWRRFDGDDYTAVTFYKGKPWEEEINDQAPLFGHLRTRTEYHGTDGNDVLTLPDTYGVGSVVLLEDDSPGDPWENSDGTDARITGIEEIQGSSFGDIIDLSSETMDYVDHNGNPMGVTVYGNGGDDTIWGNSGDDYLDGGTGSDLLIGGEGNDTLIGGAGDDVLKGSGGADLLNGGDGADKLFGGAGGDELNGGAGDDYLNGGAGNDLIDAGAGDDTVHASRGEQNEVFLGEGADTILIDADSLTPGDPIYGGGEWSALHVNDFVDGEDQFDLDGCFFSTVYNYTGDSDGSIDPALVFTENADGTGASTIVVLDNWTFDDLYNSQLYATLTA